MKGLPSSVLCGRAGAMPRKYKGVGVSWYTPAEPLPALLLASPLSLPSQRKRRRQADNLKPGNGGILEFKVYYPCLKCGKWEKPTLRVLSIVEEHISLHGIGGKFHISHSFPTS